MDVRPIVRDTRLLYMRHLRATLRTRVAVVFGVLQPLLYLLLFGPLLTRLSGVRGSATVTPGRCSCRASWCSWRCSARAMWASA